jgi:uncharacterized repeat protein (TIGR01451 family)
VSKTINLFRLKVEKPQEVKMLCKNSTLCSKSLFVILLFLVLSFTPFATLNSQTFYSNPDSIPFAPAVNYGTGDYPLSVFCADLDGDGDLDLAVANKNSDNISILKNNGDGTFQPKVDYFAGDGPNSVFCADLDADGDLDLAVPDLFTNSVSILKNNGNGTFYLDGNYVAGNGPGPVFCADLDGDSDLDLAVTNENSNSVSILKNQGNGNFQNRVEYSVGSYPRSVFCADLDGDGDLDLSVANWYSYNVSILKNNGDGTFQTKVDYPAGDGPTWVFCADLDKDSDLDLAVTNSNSNTVSILKNNGDGTFQNRVEYGVGSYPHSVFCMDLDGDGDLDLAVSNAWSEDICILKNNGDGTFQTKVDYKAGNGTHSVFSGDLDEDSDLDLAVANWISDNVSILENLTVRQPVELWADIVGRGQIRPGQQGTYYITYGNSGFVDAQDVVLWLSVPPELQYQLNIPALYDSTTEVVKTTEVGTETFIGILISEIPAESSGVITLTITPSTLNPISIRAKLFASSAVPERPQLWSEPANKAMGFMQYPPAGYLVYQNSLPFGHVGISLGNGMIADAIPRTTGRIIGFEQWQAGGGEYLGAFPPPNWTPEKGQQIAALAGSMINQPGGIPYLLWPDNKGENGHWNCVRFAEYVCEQYGCDPVQNDGLFLTPSTQYNRVSGLTWPEPVRGIYSSWNDNWEEWITSTLTKFIVVLYSWDPNDKTGSAGFDTLSHYVSSKEELHYVVFFENVDSATADAEDIVIVDTLDQSLEWSTLEIGSMSHPEPCSASFDAVNGIITWTCDSIMLPPDTLPPNGEGWGSFSIKPKSYLSSGTQIKNRSSIKFDYNPWMYAPMDSSYIINTIDADRPTTTVNSLPDTAIFPDFTVSWSGADDPGGSGIAAYTVYVKTDGGPYLPWLTDTTATSAVFHGELGHTYYFSCTAVDNVGYREERHPTFDARTTVRSFLRGDSNKDGKITVADIVYLINYLFKGGPTPVPIQSGDVNCDGKTTVSDVVYLINYLFKGGPPPC